jgi:hypothetical protein
VALAALALGLAAPAASAQALEPPFDVPYSLQDIGQPPGVPVRFGGLTLKTGTTDRLLIGGDANVAGGALYEIGVTRDAGGHITGFSDTATRYADAAYNDGGVTYGPGGVLFLARWPDNKLGMTRPGSTITDKIVDVAALGVAGSLSSVGFVPAGLPGAGSMKLARYGGGQWYDADAVADASGTYDVANLQQVAGSTLPGGPEGFVFVGAGSAEFARASLLVSEYGADNVAAYDLDANGDPVVATRRTFISGLTGAEGAFIDPVTGDFLFSTFGANSRVIVVRGFLAPGATPTPIPQPAAPPPPPAAPAPAPVPPPAPLPPPVAGKTLNALPAGGKVTIRIPPSNRFIVLGAGQQIPVGTTVDTTAGRVTLVAAAGKGGQTATADFYDGIFKLGQTAGSAPVTSLTLTEKLSCGRSGAARAAAGKKSRKLWGDGKGRFRTNGQFSSATVRGTRWLTQDSCDSTLTRVVSGVVQVRDEVKKKTVVVRAGKRYTARRR